MLKSTICTIGKNKNVIKADVAKGMKVLIKDQTFEEVEKSLIIWINKKQLIGDSISELIICEKVRQLHEVLIKHLIKCYC